MSRRHLLLISPVLALAAVLSILLASEASGQPGGVSLSPTSGPVGTAISITGDASRSGATVRAYWDSTSCGSGVDIGSAVSGSDSRFSIAATVPTATPRSYSIAVCQDIVFEKLAFERLVFAQIATPSFQVTNSPPVAVGDSSSVRLGADVFLNVTQNDSDPNVAFMFIYSEPIPGYYTHIFRLVTPAQLGTTDHGFDGDVYMSYTAGDTPGIDSFSYELCDPENACDEAMITIEVGCDEAPVAVDDDTYTMTTGDSVTIDLYAKASHPCELGSVRDRLSVDLVSQPQHGSLSEGHVYTPNANYVGADQFQFRLCHEDSRERRQCSNTATITINVQTIGPTAEANGPYEGDIGVPLKFSSDGSTDPDGTIVSAFWDFGDGTRSTDANPSHAYAEGGQFTAVLTVLDNHGAQDTDEATVIIYSPPVAGDLAETVAAGESITIDLGVEISDPDGDVDLESLVLSTGGLSGSVELVGGGLVRFVAANVETTTETSFTYDVADARGKRSNRGRVTISIRAAVTPPGEPPVAQDDAAESDGSPVTIDVLGNDATPIDLATVVVTLVEDGPLNGVAEVVGTTVVYRPGPGFAGIETFDYQVCSDDGCAVGTITVEVELLCDLTQASVETFEIDLSTTGVGDPSRLIVSLVVARLDSTCGDFELPVTFDDLPIGSVLLRLDGPLSLPVGEPAFVLAALQPEEERRIIADAVLAGTVDITVPEEVAEGTHVIRLWAGEPLVTIAEISFEVLGAAPTTTTTTTLQAQEEVPEERTDGGLPIAVVATGGLSVLAAAGAGALLLGRKRLYAEPCPGPRKSWLSAQDAADKARGEADAAESRAEEAEASAAEAEAALAACQGEPKGAGVVPLGLSIPGGGDETSVPVSDGFYLEEHPNPYAGDRAELPGWFELQRAGPVRGVVIHTGGVVPATVLTTAGVAQELATMRRPFSLHAIVDDTGVTVLLRDERVAHHLASADQDSLGVLWLPGEDEKRSLAILGAWCAAKASAHGFAIRHVGLEEWVQGDGGLVAASEFPEAAGAEHRALAWDDLLTAAKPQSGLPLAMSIGALSQGDRCFEQQQARDQAQTVAREARASATEGRARATEAEAEAEAAKQQLDDCECRHPVIATPVNAATQAQPDERDPSRWFLLAHENKNGGQRANGRHGWYHSDRGEPITGIVVHTAEAGSGPGVAAYLSKVRRPASAHVVIDGAGPVDLLPDSMVAFHAAGGNRRGLGLEIAYTASKWGKKPEKEEQLYRNSAAWCALKALQYGIPVQRVSVQQWHDGVPGFISHAELDPARRSDPGANFDWDHFFELIRGFMAGGGLLGGSGADSTVTDQ